MTLEGQTWEESRMPVLKSWYFRGAVLHEIKVENVCSSLTDVEGGCPAAALEMANEGCAVVGAE